VLAIRQAQATQLGIPLQDVIIDAISTDDDNQPGCLPGSGRRRVQDENARVTVRAHPALLATHGAKAAELVQQRLRDLGVDARGVGLNASPRDQNVEVTVTRAAGARLASPAAWRDNVLSARELRQVRKTPKWPRSWANNGLLLLYSHRNAWAILHLLGQSNAFLAAAPAGARARGGDAQGACAGAQPPAAVGPRALGVGPQGGRWGHHGAVPVFQHELSW
jgi:hypothetical protein